MREWSEAKREYGLESLDEWIVDTLISSIVDADGNAVDKYELDRSQLIPIIITIAEAGVPKAPLRR